MKELEAAEKMTIGERIKRWAKRVKKDLIMIGIIIVLILALVITIGIASKEDPAPVATSSPTPVPTPEPTPVITNVLIEGKLEEVSELTTAHLVYNGIITYEEGEVPLLTQNKFFMMYRAEVSAGVDLAEASVQVTETQVRIVLPKPEVFSVTIVSDSIEFFDVKTSWFNAADRDDAINAIVEAEADVWENGGIENLYETAREQTEVILTNLFADGIGDLELSIQFEE